MGRKNKKKRTKISDSVSSVEDSSADYKKRDLVNISSFSNEEIGQALDSMIKMNARVLQEIPSSATSTPCMTDTNNSKSSLVNNLSCDDDDDDMISMSKTDFSKLL